ncbi:tripartite tricarboxylate transporter permease [Evansella halocellulosilytica]|uniref:tripartite tricarboxylate transporter permease n=1 Tax=Evansella halocellulosilytica TaxID=2011013 RepID=UPI000BB735C9|nr:tripartite tricarboxylate transporter permease [Evansella halocellulosilytica]
MLADILYGFSVALQPENLLFVFIGVTAGMLIGVIPGLGPISAIALMIPITFGMNPATGLILMAGVYYGAVFGGSTSSILLNAPGISGTVATSFDGYPLARKGFAGKALAIAAWASFVGGTLGLIGLMVLAPVLAAFALSFGPAEYFSLMVLGLTAVISLSGKSIVKGLIVAVLGVMISIVGFDRQTGTLRYTFGSSNLYDGIDFLIVALGIFAIAEVMMMLLTKVNDQKKQIGSLKLKKAEVKELSVPTLRNSVLGFFTGVLPGAGATIASFLGYSMEKRLSKDHKTFGKGNIKGIAAPESANNAATSGSFVPLLTLGLPGSSTTAVLLGALLVMGVAPGPLMFQERPDVFWGVIASMYIGNMFLLFLNLPLIPLFAKILEIPRAILMSLIVIFCAIGVYSLNFSVFDLYLLVFFGLIGFFMRKYGFPPAPLILGLILGAIMERSLRQALQLSHGDWSILFTKPISLTLFILAVISVVGPLMKRLASKQKEETYDR